MNTTNIREQIVRIDLSVNELADQAARSVADRVNDKVASYISLVSHAISFNISFSIGFTTLAYMFNGYVISLITTKYPIFNMQNYRHWLCNTIYDDVSQLVCPL